MCANLVADYKMRLTSVIAIKGFATKYWVKYLFDSLKWKSIYSFFWNAFYTQYIYICMYMFLLLFFCNVLMYYLIGCQN